ncbi:hypothetical protein OAV41_01815 [Planctomycetota bacterium]|nr:hypothetical protein [Planctomycetota bacterium]
MFALLSLTIFLTTPIAVDCQSSVHENTSIGFKISTPKKWNEVPIKNDELWIVGRFQSNKTNYYSGKGGWTSEYKPEMTMLAFTGESMKTDIELDMNKDKDGKGESVSATFRIENPYKDYKEYLQKTYSSGGWYVDSEEKTELRGVQVTQYSIKVEKSTSYGGPRRLIAWIYHLGHADVAVQFECLEGAYEKLKREFNKRLTSFKTIERTTVVEESTQGLIEIINSDETTEERAAKRLEIELNQHAKALANLPGDWTTWIDGRFLILSHVKAKDAKEIIQQIDMMFEWLEDNFDFVGHDEYVRNPIIRICKNSDEMSLFSEGSGYSFTNIEILTCKDNSSFGEFMGGRVNDRAFEYWFYERDRELYSRIPSWFRSGMNNMLHSASMKGRQLVFDPIQRDQSNMRELIRDEKITLPSEMFHILTSDYFGYGSASSQFGCFMRYLLVGKGAKSKLTKGLVEEYLGHLKNVLDEEDAASGLLVEEDNRPQTEAEEDESFKNQKNTWQEREEFVASEVYNRTFADWTQKDWDKLDKDYLKSIK